MMKTCTKCNMCKSVEDFHKDSKVRDGRRAQCKTCRNNFVSLSRKSWSVEKRTKELNRMCVYGKQYYQKNKKKVLNMTAEWYANNKERKARTSAIWNKENLESSRLTHRAWRKKNKGVGAFYTSKYRLKLLQRTPAWSDLKKIEEFYRNRAENMVVDHIIPLQGKIVSGLHVLDNLQYLTKSENSKKSNKF